MAIWQALFHLYSSDDKSCFDYELTQRSISQLSETFPEETSWCKSIRQFGKTDSTCIELYYDEIDPLDKLAEISVRLDLRNVTEEQLQFLCAFANENNLVFGMCEDLFEPNIDILKNKIKKSDAFKFIMDPKRFFREL